jgi:23S rRNA (uracil1939-C5)-methyltransferase
MTDTASSPAPRTVRALGAEGDGIIDGAGGTVFVPFALPGEQYAGSADGWQRAGADSADRVVPVCQHFQRCGGCVAQHMGAQLYSNWKHEIVRHALSTQCVETTVSAVRTVPAASRRRATFTAERRGKVIHLGYHARRSHELIDIAECPVLLPAIVAALPALRVIAGLSLHGHEPVRLDVAALDGGLDVNIEAEGLKLDTPLRLKFAEAAAAHKLARVALNGDTIIERAVVGLATSGGMITPPPGAFFQAAGEAQAIMTELVLGAIGKPKRIADLFCGVGTFTLPLASRAKVLAVDGHKAALAALAAATRHATGLKPIETLRRDLMSEPLSAKELEDIDMVVFDPPRAGAKAQAEMIAKSAVKTVVAVSCNPVTLARDLKILISGGYTVTSVTPVDQFVYTAHIETIAVLSRVNPKRR